MGLHFEYMLILLSISLLSIIFYLYFVFKNRYTHWARKNVAHLKPTFPLGNIYDFIFQRKCIGVMYRDMYHYFKSQNMPYAGYYSFAAPHFMALEPELIKTIVTKEFAHFPDRDHYIDEENDPLTVHLAGLKRLKWKNLRAKLTPTFTSAKMKMMYQFFIQCGEQLTKVVDVQQPFDVKDLLGRYTTDVISTCAFGIEGNALTNSNAELRLYGIKASQIFYKVFFIRMLSATHDGLVKLFNLKQFGTDITNFFTNLVHETVEFRERNNVQRNDMMSLLIKLKNNENIDEEIIEKTSSGEGLTMKDVVAQTFVFLFAGFETSATTMTFCLYELAFNQDIQDKLRTDVLETIKKYNNVLTYEAVLEMSYLDKVIKETLRKYPISPFLNRRCAKQFRIPNTDVIIEKNVSVIIPTFGLHMDPDYYPDPEKFDPERFAEDQKNSRHPYVYLPFGEGPRICIGMRFGLLQIKVGIASLISKFKFTAASNIKYPVEFDKKSFFLNTRDTILLQATKL